MNPVANTSAKTNNTGIAKKNILLRISMYSRKIRRFAHHYCLVFVFRVALTGGERMDVVISSQQAQRIFLVAVFLLVTYTEYVYTRCRRTVAATYSPILQRGLEECEVKKATLAQTESHPNKSYFSGVASIAFAFFLVVARPSPPSTSHPPLLLLSIQLFP